MEIFAAGGERSSSVEPEKIPLLPSSEVFRPLPSGIPGEVSSFSRLNLQYLSRRIRVIRLHLSRVLQEKLVASNALNKYCTNVPSSKGTITIYQSS
jgi:hypothetical protein